MLGPLLSIVINNFNYARFLKEAIESALNQDYGRVEVIVVDDGSTDDSHKVIELFGSSIRPVLQANGGQGSAYNSGFFESSGEIVIFLDADDTLFSFAVTEVISILQDKDDISKIQWPLDIVDEAGIPSGRRSTKSSPPEGDLKQRILAGGPLYDDNFTTGSAYPRKFLEKVFPVPESEYRNGADVYLVTLAPVYGVVKTAPLSLGTYRIHGGNNYQGRPLDDARIHDYLRRFEANSSALETHLKYQGFDVDRDRWNEHNFNLLWLQRLAKTRNVIKELIPTGCSYILMNGDEWGLADPVPGRRAMPFVERNGEYWGPPPDDESGIQELERQRLRGVEFLVIWWTCFDWLEYLPGLARHIQSCCTVCEESDAVRVYRL